MDIRHSGVSYDLWFSEALGSGSLLFVPLKGIHHLEGHVEGKEREWRFTGPWRPLEVSAHKDD